MISSITFRQIKDLITISYYSHGQDLEFIQKKYQSTSENFEGVLSFLKGLNLLSVTNNKILFSKNVSQFLKKEVINDNIMKGFLLEKLLFASNPFSKGIYSYLSNFQISRNEFEYKPPTAKRLKESDIRNLFVELDLICYEKSNQRYKITENYFLTFANYLGKKKLTQIELSYLLIKQEELGKAAELEILKYEYDRLANFPELQKCIEHTSKSDVKAGFDIKSVEIETTEYNSESKPKYIEVKAVSLFDFRFNWTRNEIDKSELYGDQYYLYLLPVITNTRFDIERLEIIQNPFEKVYINNADWKNQVEQYSFWKEK